ncbi:uncharacterized protein LOC131709475 [Acipenser ruthenus]|uniref:uncharacterized protein LOC131709475 n=1 Tax=Acipenser ruthenus TaxID=7906 RepID=UPI00274198D8|nr:uncharacterized protein LOC131709475 [Acipenser ruthenus]
MALNGFVFIYIVSFLAMEDSPTQTGVPGRLTVAAAGLTVPDQPLIAQAGWCPQTTQTSPDSYGLNPAPLRSRTRFRYPLDDELLEPEPEQLTLDERRTSSVWFATDSRWRRRSRGGSDITEKDYTCFPEPVKGASPGPVRHRTRTLLVVPAAAKTEPDPAMFHTGSGTAFLSSPALLRNLFATNPIQNAGQSPVWPLIQTRSALRDPNLFKPSPQVRVRTRITAGPLDSFLGSNPQSGRAEKSGPIRDERGGPGSARSGLQSRKIAWLLLLELGLLIKQDFFDRSYGMKTPLLPRLALLCGGCIRFVMRLLITEKTRQKNESPPSVPEKPESAFTEGQPTVTEIAGRRLFCGGAVLHTDYSGRLEFWEMEANDEPQF